MRADLTALLAFRVFTMHFLICFFLVMPTASATPANPSTQVAQVAPAKQSAVERAEQFQRLIIAEPVMGLPTEEQLTTLKPLLSKNLQTRLQDAIQAQQTLTQRSSSPEPPWVQGALFYSLFEGASRWVHVAPEGSGSSVLVTVEYMAQPNDPSPVRWTDRFKLVIENQQPVVDDVQYLGQWDFSRKGLLSKQLDAVIAAGNNFNVQR